MNPVPVCVALCGLAFLGACKAPETTSRLDSGAFPYAISATRDIREPSQSLAAVAMKDRLAPGAALEFSDRARQVIAGYGN